MSTKPKTDNSLPYPNYIRLRVDGVIGTSNHIYDRMTAGTMSKAEYDSRISDMLIQFMDVLVDIDKFKKFDSKNKERREAHGFSV